MWFILHQVQQTQNETIKDRILKFADGTKILHVVNLPQAANSLRTDVQHTCPCFMDYGMANALHQMEMHKCV